MCVCVHSGMWSLKDSVCVCVCLWAVTDEALIVSIHGRWCTACCLSRQIGFSSLLICWEMEPGPPSRTYTEQRTHLFCPCAQNKHRKSQHTQSANFVTNSLVITHTVRHFVHRWSSDAQLCLFSLIPVDNPCFLPNRAATTNAFVCVCVYSTYVRAQKTEMNELICFSPNHQHIFGSFVPPCSSLISSEWILYVPCMCGCMYCMYGCVYLQKNSLHIQMTFLENHNLEAEQSWLHLELASWPLTCTEADHLYGNHKSKNNSKQIAVDVTDTSECTP